MHYLVIEDYLYCVYNITVLLEWTEAQIVELKRAVESCDTKFASITIQLLHDNHAETKSVHKWLVNITICTNNLNNVLIQLHALFSS